MFNSPRWFQNSGGIESQKTLGLINLCSLPDGKERVHAERHAKNKIEHSAGCQRREPLMSIAFEIGKVYRKKKRLKKQTGIVEILSLKKQ